MDWTTRTGCGGADTTPFMTPAHHRPAHEPGPPTGAADRTEHGARSTEHGQTNRAPAAGTRRGPDQLIAWEPQEAFSSASRSRVRFGSTGMPGPMVVEKVIFFRKRPLAADGFARSTSSSATA
ncbi:hypothetical protein AHOG_02760 [Actinoalloteichus hoggarensis]|uniref:Uncharacterized protein n=1 Tax=Actinoalloteichus hoggarensis TaxID=1470176 RepID=A0A221VXE3_9PSEU|nr:hypothetical protein AHOG_02760 [Actinoalloteichus hoggarensis]